jgi:hypothetical protein
MRGEDCGDSEGAWAAGMNVGAGICVGRTLLETDVLGKKRKTRLKPRMSNPAYFKSRYGDALRREYRVQGGSLSMDHSLDMELRLLSLMVYSFAETRKGFNDCNREMSSFCLRYLSFVSA